MVAGFGRTIKSTGLFAYETLREEIKKLAQDRDGKERCASGFTHAVGSMSQCVRDKLDIDNACSRGSGNSTAQTDGNLDHLRDV